MESTRLQRIMQRQLDVERKLREREAQRLAQEHAKRASRAEEVRIACAELERNQESFHKIDEMLGGYRGADSRTHAVVARTATEEKVLKTQESMYTNKVTQGPLRGSEWTKTSLGWLRIETCGNMYKQPCTKDALPAWLYEELDVIFGLRRISSYDFILTCFILNNLFNQYIDKEDTSKAVKKRMVFDIQLAIARIKKNPGCVMREQALIPALAVLDKLEVEINKLYPPPNHNKNNNNDNEISPSLSLSQEINLPLDDDPQERNINTTLPEELLLHVFSFLFNPRDLCTASNVCVSWSTLANDNSLFHHFIIHLCKLLGIDVPDSPIPRKELFVQLWTHKIGVPMSGLYQCVRCRELYWVFKKSFCPGYTGWGTSKYHVGGTVDIPISIDISHVSHISNMKNNPFIRTITDRVQHY